MSDWMLVVMVIVVYLLGFIVGLFAERRKNRGTDGILIVDKVMPEANGGVYFQAFANPQTYADGQKISLEVMWFTEDDMPASAVSQEEQEL